MKVQKMLELALSLSSFAKPIDDSAQGEETLVDGSTLLHAQSLSACFGNALRTCQVNKCQRGHPHCSTILRFCTLISASTLYHLDSIDIWLLMSVPAVRTYAEECIRISAHYADGCHDVDTTFWGVVPACLKISFLYKSLLKKLLRKLQYACVCCYYWTVLFNTAASGSSEGTNHSEDCV